MRTCGECKCEGRAVWAGPHVGCCAVGLSNAGHNSQPQPGPWHASCGWCPVKALEDARQVVVGYAWAVIGDRYLAALDNHANGGIEGSPLDRVVDQITNRVVDRSRVDVHKAGVKFCIDGCVRDALPHSAQGLVDEQVQPDGLAMRRRLVVTREVE